MCKKHSQPGKRGRQQRLSGVRKTRLNAMIGALCLASPAFAVDVSWVGPAASTWNGVANWSGGVVPNNGGTRFNVFIDAGNAQNTDVSLNLNVAIDNLTISSGDILTFLDSRDLTLVGTDPGTLSTLTNAGTLRLLGSASATDLTFNATNNSITGGGLIQMQNTARLLVGAASRATNVNNAIEGDGAFMVNSGAFTNQGTIRSNTATRTLTIDPGNVTDAFLNTGNLVATGGGNLVLTGNGLGAFNNTGGTIRAEAGSEVQLVTNVIISGGVFTSTGSGVIRTNLSQSSFLADIANSGNMVSDNNSDFGVSGIITNSGSININATTGATDIELQADTTFTGGGVVTLADLDTTVTNNQANINGTGIFRLTNTNHTIQGHGNISQNQLAITNEATGLIHANVSGGILTLDPANTPNALVNNGTLRASNGGVMLLTGNGLGNFTNNNTIEALAGSEVRLATSANVSGGMFSTSGDGIVRLMASHNAFFTNVSNSGNMVADNNSDFGVSGTITNSGAININATVSATDIELQTDTTLTGGGALTLADLDTAVNNNQARINGVGIAPRLTNVNHTIQGHGDMGVNSIAITNGVGGLIHANVPGGTLTVDPANTANAFVNNGTLRASNGGVMLLTGNGLGDFTNNSIIEALAGSEVRFSTSARLTGGVLSTAGDGTLRVIASGNAFFTNISNSGNMVADNNSDFGVSGTITNSGAININSTVSATDLELQTDTTFTGGGVVTLADLDTAVNNNQARINGVGVATRLTNANHTIQGHGDIGVNTIVITNEVGGLIHANAAGGSLILDPANTPNAFINSGTLRASNNSTLVLSGNGLGDFSGNGSIVVDADGTVQTLSNPLVSAGPVTLNGTWSNTASANITVTNFRGAGHLSLSGGSFTVRAGGGTAGTSRIKDLTITLARLDLTDHDLVIDYDAADASPIATIRGYLQTGFANGAWNGQGIRTSNGTSNGFGIGYGEATGIFTSFPAVFSGQSVDNTTVLLKFTRFGDADFSGNVNLNDFNRLAANFGGSGLNWSSGDFNYDGLVNLSDFNLLAANFGLSASPGGPTPNDWATLASAVPEPGALGVLGTGLLLARRRRR